MSSEPAVEVATPSVAGNASGFVRQVAPIQGDERALFVGLDIEDWQKARHSLPRISQWVSDFNKEMWNKKPNQFAMTTVIILAWPQTLPGQLDQHERFRDLVLSGCKLRYKRPDIYPVGGSNLIDSFRRDLDEAGWLRLPDTSLPPPPLDPPKFDTEEEDQEYRQILDYYGNPPFRWSAADKKRVFPQSPP